MWKHVFIVNLILATSLMCTQPLLAQYPYQNGVGRGALGGFHNPINEIPSTISVPGLQRDPFGLQNVPGMGMQGGFGRNPLQQSQIHPVIQNRREGRSPEEVIATSAISRLPQPQIYNRVPLPSYATNAIARTASKNSRNVFMGIVGGILAILVGIEKILGIDKKKPDSKPTAMKEISKQVNPIRKQRPSPSFGLIDAVVLAGIVLLYVAMLLCIII